MESTGNKRGRALVFTPTYNEKDNIEEFCRRVLGQDEDLHLLVVDDNSPDGTGRILERIRRDEDRLIVIHRPGKMGIGSAHKLAMEFAIREGYGALVTMDSDFSHRIEDIPRLLASLEGCDFVIGSRFMSGGRCDYRGYRAAVSAIANRAARALLGITLHEFTTSFRAFRVEALQWMDLDRLGSQGYSFFVESLFLVARSGLAYREIPIHFMDRMAGSSKIPRFEILNGMLKLLGLIASRWLRAPVRRPAARGAGPASHASWRAQATGDSGMVPEGASDPGGGLVACAEGSDTEEARSVPAVRGR